MRRSNHNHLAANDHRMGDVTLLARKLRVSPQRAWQILRIQEGKCKICGKAPIYSSGRCEPCYRKEQDKRKAKS
jgi:hypothetical protein